MEKPKFFEIHWSYFISIGVGYRYKELVFMIPFVSVHFNFEMFNQKDEKDDYWC